MSRVKRGPIPRRRHKRVFKQTEGFVGSRNNRFREAVKCLRKSWQYAYVGRKKRKRDMRELWITRINAACRVNGVSYSRFIHGLKVKSIDLNRKALADLAVGNPAGFAALTQLIAS